MSETTYVIGYFESNLGDDLMIEVVSKSNTNVIYFLRAADFKAKSSSANLQVSKSFYDFIRSKELSFIGGSLFYDYGPTSVLQFFKRFLIVAGAKLLGKKVSINGANIGPFKYTTSRILMKGILSLCDSIEVRDKDSYSFARSCNNRSSLKLDIVDEYYYRANGKIKQEPEQASLGLSLVGMRSKTNQAIIEKAEEIIETRKIDKIKLFAFCKHEGDQEEVNKLSQEWKKTYANIEIIVVNYNGDVSNVEDEIATCYYFIGGRFHSIIIANHCCKKTYVVGYSDKFKNYFSSHYHISWVSDAVFELSARKAL
ncbi:polysaccharide pyruvyl transferase family protein [Halomonas sp. DP5Y7-2]|uniref:polysaccharide pyruvyl transferase family protein n=1 Tax=Halomonas sp. DP5Y7-2 TaxID=2859076 RepID=UPI001C9968B7|nr:polysaccharide pyruvyl transferase family protein [Halomonas sp. DP5Y7-2]MBY5985166.1 polysaccharide pyruvyl transferase family protein [Halomonas sp. DP5Y7-2]